MQMEQSTNQRDAASTSRVLSCFSPVNLLAVPYAQDEHSMSIVLDFADQPEWANPILPKFPEMCSLERPPDTAWIIQLGQSFIKKS